MDWTPITREDPRRLEILAHLDAGLSCREIKERMGLKYVMQVAGVKAGLTRRLKANAERDEEDTEIEVSDQGSDQGFVECSDVLRCSAGAGVVYGAEYPGYPLHLKLGSTSGLAVDRIAQWSGATAAPDALVLVLEIKSDRPRELERLLHAMLDWRGKRIRGEWFAVMREEVIALYEAMLQDEARQ